MPRPALGLVMALAGALIITPDTLLIRFSSFKWWGLTFWRGMPIYFSLIVFWIIMAGPRRARDQLTTLLGGQAIVIIIANSSMPSH